MDNSNNAEPQKLSEMWGTTRFFIKHSFHQHFRSKVMKGSASSESKNFLQNSTTLVRLIRSQNLAVTDAAKG